MLHNRIRKYAIVIVGKSDISKMNEELHCQEDNQFVYLCRFYDKPFRDDLPPKYYAHNSYLAKKFITKEDAEKFLTGFQNPPYKHAIVLLDIPHIRPIDEELADCAYNHNKEGVLRCLEQDADINAVDEDNEDSAFTLACDMSALFEKLKTEEERIDFGKFLLEQGADINVHYRSETNCGTTALYGTVVRGEVEMVKFLLDNGADPNINFFPDEEPHINSTVLDIAETDEWLDMRGLAPKHREIIKLLEKAGAVN